MIVVLNINLSKLIRLLFPIHTHMNISISILSRELYICSFKHHSSLKTPDECFTDITTIMELKCSENEITKLSITYTSLGELFEAQIDKDEKFFDYLDLMYDTDTLLFENLHTKFIINVLNNIRLSLSCNLTSLLKIGCIALIGNKLNGIQINKKYPSPFSKTFLLSMIEEQKQEQELSTTFYNFL